MNSSSSSRHAAELAVEMIIVDRIENKLASTQRSCLDNPRWNRKIEIQAVRAPTHAR